MVHQFESHLTHTIVWQKFLVRARKAAKNGGMKAIPKRDLAMLRPLFLQAAGRSMASTNQLCDCLARKRSENVWGSPMSFTKLSSHLSRNAKLRPKWKRKSSSFRAATDRRFEFDKGRQLFIRTDNEPLPIASMCVCNPDCLPVGINR